jgi:hypothetical protein
MPNTPLSYDTPATSILGLIGGTPLVRIQRMCPNPKVTIMAKLEGFKSPPRSTQEPSSPSSPIAAKST